MLQALMSRASQSFHSFTLSFRSSMRARSQVNQRPGLMLSCHPIPLVCQASDAGILHCSILTPLLSAWAANAKAYEFLRVVSEGFCRWLIGGCWVSQREHRPSIVFVFASARIPEMAAQVCGCCGESLSWHFCARTTREAAIPLRQGA